MTSHDDTIYLHHIVDSISKIEGYIAEQTFDEFIGNDLVIDGVVRNFEIIGEASSKISKEYKEQHSEVSFQLAIDMRNRLIHGYDDVNLEFVWATIQDDFPQLKSQIKKII